MAIYEHIDTQTIMESATEARNTTLRLTGFDLFSSALFLEHLTILLMGGEPTAHGDRIDAYVDGIRVEIKTSQLQYVANHAQRYTFYRLDKFGKNPDCYALVGHDNGLLEFFVLDRSFLSAKKSASVSITPTRLRTYHSWKSFYTVDPSNLRGEILRRRGNACLSTS